MTDDIWFIDAATRTGVAEGVPGSIPRLYTVKFSKEGDEPPDTFGRAVLWLAERLAVSQPRAIYIEAPMPPGVANKGAERTAVSLLLIGIYGALAGVARARRIPCRPANVRTIRAFVLGQGNMRGELAKIEAKRIAIAEGASPANYDEADAWAGWRWASHLYGGPPAPKNLWITQC